MSQALMSGPGCCNEATSASATPIGWYLVDNRAEARELTSSANNKVAVLKGLVDAGDGLGGIYTWDNANTEADDGVTVLEPDDSTGAGRWIKLI